MKESQGVATPSSLHNHRNPHASSSRCFFLTMHSVFQSLTSMAEPSTPPGMTFHSCRMQSFTVRSNASVCFLFTYLTNAVPTSSKQITHHPKIIALDSIHRGLFLCYNTAESPLTFCGPYHDNYSSNQLFLRHSRTSNNTLSLTAIPSSLTHLKSPSVMARFADPIDHPLANLSQWLTNVGAPESRLIRRDEQEHFRIVAAGTSQRGLSGQSNFNNVRRRMAAHLESLYDAIYCNSARYPRKLLVLRDMQLETLPNTPDDRERLFIQVNNKIIASAEPRVTLHFTIAANTFNILILYFDYDQPTKGYLFVPETPLADGTYAPTVLTALTTLTDNKLPIFGVYRNNDLRHEYLCFEGWHGNPPHRLLPNNDFRTRICQLIQRSEILPRGYNFARMGEGFC